MTLLLMFLGKICLLFDKTICDSNSRLRPSRSVLDTSCGPANASQSRIPGSLSGFPTRVALTVSILLSFLSSQGLARRKLIHASIASEIPILLRRAYLCIRYRIWLYLLVKILLFTMIFLFDPGYQRTRHHEAKGQLSRTFI